MDETVRRRRESFVASGRAARRASAPRRQASRGWRGLLSNVIAVAFAGCLVAFVAAPMLQALEVTGRVETSVSARPFDLCGRGARINCVVDGDTLHVDGETIRIADIDTPEVSSPQCASELALGNRATRALLALINASPFDLETSGSRYEDVYGRKLRVLSRDGESLGQKLVASGLARQWDGARHPWCV